MTGSILSYHQTDPIRLLCEISLKKLLPARKEGDWFDKNWHEIVKPGVIFCLRPKNPLREKRTAAGLQSGQDFAIPNKQEQATGASDFELITWPVIKSGEADG